MLRNVTPNCRVPMTLTGQRHTSTARISTLGRTMSSLSPQDLQVEALRTRLTGAFPLMMLAALEPFDDESIWWQPAPDVNPIAVLALHCAGNLRHFIGRYVGGSDYERNRPQEFDSSRRLTKREVLDEFNGAIDEVRATMARLRTEDYAKPSRDPEDRHAMVYEDFINATVHLALHVGQAVQLAKLKGYDLGDKVWGDAHRSSGAWNA
jgi:DinB family protein